MTPLLFLTLACAETSEPEATTSPLSGGASTTFFTAEIPGYFAGDDGELVAQLIEDVPGGASGVVTATLQVPVTEYGYFELELPTPLDASIDSVRYRVAVREALPDGTAGAFRGIWSPRLTWHATLDAAGAPTGWSTERVTHGSLSWTPIEASALKLSLLPVESLTVGGTFDIADVVTEVGSSVRVALLDGDEVVDGAIGMVLDGTWALRLDGEPDSDSTQLRPVAFIDANNDLAYDPDSESRLGLACVDDVEGFVKWVGAPYTVGMADTLKKHHASVGWNVWMEGGSAGVPAGSAALSIAASCD